MRSSHAVRLAAACLIMACAAAPARAAEPDDAPVAIRHLMHARFDRPGTVLEIEPLVVGGQWAVADWLQADHGGRALLRRVDGRWQVIACGGRGLLDAGTLIQAGVPRPDARAMTARLARLERALPPARIARFDAFGPVADVREDPGHGAHGVHGERIAHPR